MTEYLSSGASPSPSGEAYTAPGTGAPSARAPSAGPTLVIPGFTVVEEIHRGRTRVVYRGRRDRDGVPVMVKVLADDVAGAGAASLRREYELLRSLDIPGVPRALGLLPYADRAALVLEEVSGTRLETLLASGPLDVPTFLRVAIELAELVGQVHRRGIIHKDVNPNNILVDPEDDRVALIDFGIASRLPAEQQRLGHPSVLEGTLAYMSPEQTGRMNRDIDYRTDLYSLGVTFYEMLTGRLPFDSRDPLELVHWHIARTPTAPAELNASVPRPLSDIVLRLLAKSAEDRYQSALGLKADLSRCSAQLERTGRLEEPAVRAADVSHRFVVPQRLYGREREVELLLAAFDRACGGSVELMLVSGYSGIGKTALIQELYKPLVRRRGYFIPGKFDQIARIPYGAFVQAFRALVQQLLTEGESELAALRSRLSQALGALGGVLAEVVPEIELIIGRQSRPAVVGPTEAQNRFRLVLQNFLRALARPEHPVVIFLDDLQWADSATLSILEPLLTSPELRSLFLIGAYRDNEVGPGHPLTRAIEALPPSGVRVDRLALGPLALPDLTSLVRDALRRTTADAEPLARLVLEKTGGNPFFVIQFLKALHDAGLLRFDYDASGWVFQIEAIAAAGMTDNVIDLMTRKIRRLPARTQTALTLAACVGNRFDLETLAIASREPADAISAELQEALAEGLVRAAPAGAHGRVAGDDPAATAFTFLHDRVQQAAYALIPEDRKQLVHLTVGRLLLERWDSSAADEKTFAVVNHLNTGRKLIADARERLTLAELNLRAGRRAKASTAYHAALEYCAIGTELLPPDCWGSAYELTFALHLERFEAQHLAGHTEDAERTHLELLPLARTRLDQARVYAQRIVQLENLSRYGDAIRLGAEALARFGVIFPESPEERLAAVDRELARIDALLGERSIQSLADLPAMRDPETRAVMGLLVTLHISGYLIGDKPFTLLNTATMVRLSLEHGNSEESAYAYVLHAMLLALARARYEEAYEFGTLGLKVADRLPDARLRARSLMNFAWAVSPWRMPLEASLPICRETHRVASEVGLFTEAAWALFNENWIRLLTTRDLAAFAADCAQSLDGMRRIRMDHIADGGEVILQWARALQGQTSRPGSLSDAHFDEAEYLRAQEGNSLNRMFYYVAKLGVLYLVGDLAGAEEVARRSEYIPRDFTGNIWDEQRTFYYALTLAASVRPERPLPGPAAAELNALLARLRLWAENSPRNFEPQYLIASAEAARAGDRADEAARLYEAAIRAATTHERLLEGGLARELYGRFWWNRGRRRVASMFLTEAREAYADLGAAVKVRDLEARYPELFGTPHAELRPRTSSAAPASPAQVTVESKGTTLDLATVMKAAQAISGEIELEALLGKLLRIAIENAGAERGTLVLEDRDEPFVRADGSVASAEVRPAGAAPLSSATGVPATIVNYVRRTSESVVVADVRADDRFASDPYVSARQPRSIMCVPVLNQRSLVGVLYLENNLTTGAFTPDRIEVVRLLSAQAAIAIRNAELFVEVSRLRDRLQAENVYLHEEIKTHHGFEDIVGRSAALKRVLHQVEQVAPTETTVLIMGETGTGKELVARAIHHLSPRRDKPLVTVNCAAIAAGLVESELFGHEKGAFTGALAKKIGRFELADGGTIFLDEIGDLPLELQVKLLRVLQEREIERVGGTAPIAVDVRVIAATHRELDKAVEGGRFRSDLYYRLNVFPIRMPALRERREDIPLLVRYFVASLATKVGKRVDAIPKDVMDALTNYPWPGNIRELRNVIERSVIITQGATLQLGDWIAPAAGAAAGGPLRSLESVEREHILQVLGRTGWRVSGARGAAQVLGLKPTTLEARMKKLGIERPH